jgi:hypothetical protein
MHFSWLDWLVTIPGLAAATLHASRQAMKAVVMQPDDELIRELRDLRMPGLEPEVRAWKPATGMTWLLRAGWFACSLACARALNSFVALALGS